jgi:hypothetical protein
MTYAGIARALGTGVILVTLIAWGMTARAAAGPEPQASPTAVRSGNHPDFGRVVVDTTGKTTYRLDQDGDHVAVHFSRDMTLGAPPALPRNVVSIKIDGSTIDLVLKHGVKIHPMRLDGRVVLDVLDAPDKAAAPAAVRQGDIRTEPGPRSSRTMPSSREPAGQSGPASGVPPVPASAERTPVAAQSLPPASPLPPAPSKAVQPGQTQGTPTQAGRGQSGTALSGTIQSGPVQPSVEPKAADLKVADSDVIEATQQTPPGRDVLPENEGPVGLLARRIKLPQEIDGAAFLVPFDASTGAASFRSGDNTYIVFDERRPVDMRALRNDPVFGGATVQLLPGGTLFRIPLPPAQSLALTQMPRGWRIAALTTALKEQPIVASFVDGHLDLAAEQPSEVVSLADPDTGATLLAGTQHRPGQGVAAWRRASEFILRPTIQGVVVEPLSDAIALKQVPTGFILTGGSNGLALSAPTSATDGLMDAALLTRRFAFSTMPAEALLRSLVRQLGDSAASPPLARGQKNHTAAETLLALGLAAEAESLLHLAAEQDPKEAASIDTGALTAIAALIAGRPDEAAALADPRLDGTDEISLWRAMRQAMLDEGSPAAAAVFAATAPLAFQYPKPIREHILPLIIETMIEGGEIGPAAHLLTQRKNDPRLAYARALMKQAEGDTDQALILLDALANGHDQFDRARAAVRAVEMRLAARKLDRIQAADALDKLLYAWRGDARELALRERIADLRGQTGAWRVALATLRQADADFPEQDAAIRGRLRDMFASMIRDRGEQQIPAIDFVSTVDENADLVAGATDDEAVQQSLADRLLALDLPDRAKPVLEKLTRSARSEVAKARFGTSLATIESREGDDAAVRATLDGSDGRDLPVDLVEKRTILRAGSVARMGDPAAAGALLAPLHTGSAAEARAQILENASDWAGAERAWADCAALTLPESGMLDETQTRTVLRLTTATARANDDAGLTELRGKYGNRIGASPLGDMFRLLTVEPIRTSADIKRSQREVSLAASLPANLKALQAATVSR